MIMDYLPHKTLKDKLKICKKFTEQETAKIAK